MRNVLEFGLAGACSLVVVTSCANQNGVPPVTCTCPPSGVDAGADAAQAMLDQASGELAATTDGGQTTADASAEIEVLPGTAAETSQVLDAPSADAADWVTADLSAAKDTELPEQDATQPDTASTDSTAADTGATDATQPSPDSAEVASVGDKCWPGFSKVKVDSSFVCAPDVPVWGASVLDPTDQLIDQGDGTVLDVKTKLLWQKTNAAPAASWVQAEAYCDDLTTAGHTDWRLPTVTELATTRKLTDQNLALPFVLLEKWSNKTTFATATVAVGVGTHWNVEFTFGGVSNVSYGEYRPRCVRAKVPPAQPAVPRFVVGNVNQTVLDNYTKLTWQRLPTASALDFDKANAYCKGFAVGGTGWRLPSITELESIADRFIAQPAWDPVFGTQGQEEVFWSSTPLGPFSGAGWALYAYAGLSKLAADDTNYVRCVRE